MRSPLVWGGLVTIGFYTLLDSGQFAAMGLGGPVEEYFKRYFAGHWVEYVEGGLFFLGMAALVIKLFDVVGQFGTFGKPLLNEANNEPQAPAHCELLLAKLDALPERLKQSLLGIRLKEALEHVRRAGSADKLDEELKYLSDMAALQAHGSYALVRIIIWAIPIMGFLGTVIGITMAIANISPQQLEESLPEVTAGLGVAFDTTAVALTQSIFLMFGQFICDKLEGRLLARVDARALAELAGRFQQIGGGGDPQVAAVRRMAEAVLQTTERMVQRQAELWQSTIEQAQQRWLHTTNTTQQQLETALSRALSASLQSHAQQLTAAEQAAAEQNHRHWSGVQQALVRSTEAIATQQRELAQQGVVLKQIVEATGQVTRLEESLNRNLAALAGSQNFEETVQSLAAVIHLLNARLGQAPAVTQVARNQPRNVGQAA
jgi:biopolymer transport protein ExbB/TolQ